MVKLYTALTLVLNGGEWTTSCPGYFSSRNAARLQYPM